MDETPMKGLDEGMREMEDLPNDRSVMNALETNVEAEAQLRNRLMAVQEASKELERRSAPMPYIPSNRDNIPHSSLQTMPPSEPSAATSVDLSQIDTKGLADQVAESIAQYLPNHITVNRYVTKPAQHAVPLPSTSEYHTIPDLQPSRSSKGEATSAPTTKPQVEVKTSQVTVETLSKLARSNPEYAMQLLLQEANSVDPSQIHQNYTQVKPEPPIPPPKLPPRSVNYFRTQMHNQQNPFPPVYDSIHPISDSAESLSGDSSAVAPASLLPRLRRFGGREDENVEDWLMINDLLFDALQIPPEVRRITIPTLIHADAARAYLSYEWHKRVSYHDLKEAFVCQFSSPGLKQAAQARVKDRVQKPSESPRAYALQLQRLIQKGFSDLSTSAKENLRGTFFRMGLHAEIQSTMAVLDTENMPFIELLQVAERIYQSHLIQKRQQQLARQMAEANQMGLNDNYLNNADTNNLPTIVTTKNVVNTGGKQYQTMHANENIENTQSMSLDQKYVRLGYQRAKTENCIVCGQWGHAIEDCHQLHQYLNTSSPQEDDNPIIYLYPCNYCEKKDHCLIYCPILAERAAKSYEWRGRKQMSAIGQPSKFRYEQQNRYNNNRPRYTDQQLQQLIELPDSNYEMNGYAVEERLESPILEQPAQRTQETSAVRLNAKVSILPAFMLTMMAILTIITGVIPPTMAQSRLTGRQYKMERQVVLKSKTLKDGSILSITRQKHFNYPPPTEPLINGTKILFYPSTSYGYVTNEAIGAAAAPVGVVVIEKEYLYIPVVMHTLLPAWVPYDLRINWIHDGCTKDPKQECKQYIPVRGIDFQYEPYRATKDLLHQNTNSSTFANSTCKGNPIVHQIIAGIRAELHRTYGGMVGDLTSSPLQEIYCQEFPELCAHASTMTMNHTIHRRFKRVLPALAIALIGAATLSITGGIALGTVNRVHIEQLKVAIRQMKYAINKLIPEMVKLQKSLDIQYKENTMIIQYLRGEAKRMQSNIERLRCESIKRANQLLRQVITARLEEYLHRTVDAIIRTSITGKLDPIIMGVKELRKILADNPKTAKSMLTLHPRLVYQRARVYPILLDLNQLRYAYILEIPVPTQLIPYPVYEVLNTGFHQKELHMLVPLPNHLYQIPKRPLQAIDLSQCEQYPGIWYCDSKYLTTSDIAGRLTCLPLLLEIKAWKIKRMFKACERFVQIGQLSKQETQVKYSQVGMMLRTTHKSITIFPRSNKTRDTDRYKIDGKIHQMSPTGTIWLSNMEFSEVFVGSQMYWSGIGQMTNVLSIPRKEVIQRPFTTYPLIPPKMASMERVSALNDELRHILSNVKIPAPFVMAGKSIRLLVVLGGAFFIVMIGILIGITIWCAVKKKACFRTKAVAVRRRQKKTSAFAEQLIMETVQRLSQVEHRKRPYMHRTPKRFGKIFDLTDEDSYNPSTPPPAYGQIKHANRKLNEPSNTEIVPIKLQPISRRPSNEITSMCFQQEVRIMHATNRIMTNHVQDRPFPLRERNRMAAVDAERYNRRKVLLTEPDPGAISAIVVGTIGLTTNPCGLRLRTLFDTGSGISTIVESAVVALKQSIDPIEPNSEYDKTILSSTGEAVQHLGTIELMVWVQGHLYPCLFYVVNDWVFPYSVVLGRDFLNSVGSMSIDYNRHKIILQDTLDKYKFELDLQPIGKIYLDDHQERLEPSPEDFRKYHGMPFFVHAKPVTTSQSTSGPPPPPSSGPGDRPGGGGNNNDNRGGFDGPDNSRPPMGVNNNYINTNYNNTGQDQQRMRTASGSNNSRMSAVPMDQQSHSVSSPSGQDLDSNIRTQNEQVLDPGQATTSGFNPSGQVPVNSAEDANFTLSSLLPAPFESHPLDRYIEPTSVREPPPTTPPPDTPETIINKLKAPLRPRRYQFHIPARRTDKNPTGRSLTDFGRNNDSAPSTAALSAVLRQEPQTIWRNNNGSEQRIIHNTDRNVINTRTPEPVIPRPPSSILRPTPRRPTPTSDVQPTLDLSTSPQLTHLTQDFDTGFRPLSRVIQPSLPPDSSDLGEIGRYTPVSTDPLIDDLIDSNIDLLESQIAPSLDQDPGREEIDMNLNSRSNTPQAVGVGVNERKSYPADEEVGQSPIGDQDVANLNDDEVSSLDEDDSELPPKTHTSRYPKRATSLYSTGMHYYPTFKERQAKPKPYPRNPRREGFTSHVPQPIPPVTEQGRRSVKNYLHSVIGSCTPTPQPQPLPPIRNVWNPNPIHPVQQQQPVPGVLHRAASMATLPRPENPQLTKRTHAVSPPPNFNPLRNKWDNIPPDWLHKARRAETGTKYAPEVESLLRGYQPNTTNSEEVEGNEDDIILPHATAQSHESVRLHLPPPRDIRENMTQETMRKIIKGEEFTEQEHEHQMEHILKEANYVISLPQELKIPAQSEVMVHALLELQTPVHTLAIVEGDQEFQQQTGVLIASAVIRLDRWFVPLLLANPTNLDQIIQDNRVIAQAKPVAPCRIGFLRDEDQVTLCMIQQPIGNTPQKRVNTHLDNYQNPIGKFQPPPQDKRQWRQTLLKRNTPRPPSVAPPPAMGRGKPTLQVKPQPRQTQQLGRGKENVPPKNPPMQAPLLIPSYNDDYTLRNMRTQQFLNYAKEWCIDVDNLSREQIMQLIQVLQDNRRVFTLHEDDFGCCNQYSVAIETADSPPVRATPYRIPYTLRDTLKKELNQLLEQDIIEPSTSPWGAPILYVKKKDGTWRLCIDFRALNKVTKPCIYPLPRIDDIFDTLQGTNYFSSVDLAKGFWQLPIKDEHKEKSAFTTMYGQFQFKRMPMGLAVAPGCFQQCMDKVLSGLQWIKCLVYLDDILVFSKDWQEHLDTLSEIFKRLVSANLKIKLRKCTFAYKELHHLGHILSEKGLKPDEGSVAAIVKIPQPKNLKDIQAFMGCVNYYSRFIDNMAHEAKLINDLRKPKNPFKWTDQHTVVFNKLKDLLTKAPVLKHPDFSKDFILYTDASGYGLGAVLSQESEDGIHPIAYASRVIRPAESRYSPTEKEALALKWAVKHFRNYLLGRPFVAITDHQPLVWLMNVKHKNCRLAKYSLELSEYQMTIKYRPGKQNANADLLSRYPIQLTQKQQEKVEQKKNSPISNKERKKKIQEDQWENMEPIDLDEYAEQMIQKQQEKRKTVKKVTFKDEVDSSAANTSGSERESDSESKPIKKRDVTLNKESIIMHMYHVVEDAPAGDIWAKLPELQLEDEMAGAIIRYIRARELPVEPKKARIIILSEDRYIYQDRILYKLITQRIGRTTMALYLPHQLRRTIMDAAHKGAMAGHPSPERTYYRLVARYYWPGMYADVKKYCATCHVCASIKHPGVKTKVPLGRMNPVPAAPMIRMHCDIVAFPTAQGSAPRYFVGFIDAFSKYVVGEAIRKEDATTVARVFLKRVILRFGIPLYLISDRGPQFTAKVNQELFRQFQVKHITTTPYHPAANGQIERFHRTLKTMLATLLEEYGGSWHKYIQQLLFAYNTTYNRAIEDTPHFLMHGWDPYIPSLQYEGMVGNVPGQMDKYELTEALSQSWQTAAKAIAKIGKENKINYDRTVKGKPMKLNDLVMCETHVRDPFTPYKLLKKYAGPYRILQISDTNAWIRLIHSPDARVYAVHLNRLKKTVSETSEEQFPLTDDPLRTEFPEGTIDLSKTDVTINRVDDTIPISSALDMAPDNTMDMNINVPPPGNSETIAVEDVVTKDNLNSSNL